MINRISRKELLARIKHKPEISVLIVGAGINGIGTFRDLALQGVDVLLVERSDFCSGASMSSSHMLHGGIRYLENGEFRLVKEALRERNRLLRNAPHLAKPLPTTIPIFKRFSGLFNAPLKFLGLLNKPGERGALVIKIGLMLYDFFVCGDGSMPRHTFRSKQQSLERWPELNRDLLYTATYYDGAMPSPERICIELISDAQAANDLAVALNYMRVIGKDADQIRIQDELSGDEYFVTPRVIVNAAGPWIDFTNLALGHKTGFIGGTKGSHIILAHPVLNAALQNNEFFFEYFDGRIVLIYPYYDKVMIGTTDIRINDPDQARCEESEIDYMLNMVAHVFPEIRVSREQILFHFTGVRPLPAADSTATGQISRDHTIECIQLENERSYPVFCLVGGKWTSFRAFAEQATDRVLSFLGKERASSTEEIPIGGGRGYPSSVRAVEDWVRRVALNTGLPEQRIQYLFERYGTNAEQFARFAAQFDDTPLKHNSKYTKSEITFIVDKESVIHLDDLVVRRTLMAWMGELNIDLLRELAMITGNVLGWDDKKQSEEVCRTIEILSDRHGVKF